MPRIALIVNPDSGRGGSERVAELLAAAGAEVEAFTVEGAAGAGRAGSDRIAIAGGDGSIGPAAAAAGAAGVPLAVIATGTANDFATHFALPRAVERACELAVHGVETRHVELARAGARPFVNVASAGLAPAAAAEASGLKESLGPLAYPVGAVAAGINAEPFRCVVIADGTELFSGDAWQVSVASSGAFGSGASFRADTGDGRLDVVAIEHGSRARLVKHAYGLRLGEVEEQAGVISTRAEAVELRLDPERTLNIDGELVRAGELDQGGSIRFSAERAGFELVTG
ncbi:MAG TPA: diacylglycerol kinase family protein [Solirubrobacterales bacterium]|nr:diacylglycerol kinase family protein [Solirubrobacterales bacterium]